jgi:hypothetical protein
VTFQDIAPEHTGYFASEVTKWKSGAADATERLGPWVVLPKTNYAWAGSRRGRMSIYPDWLAGMVAP